MWPGANTSECARTQVTRQKMDSSGGGGADWPSSSVRAASSRRARRLQQRPPAGAESNRDAPSSCKLPRSSRPTTLTSRRIAHLIIMGACTRHTCLLAPSAHQTKHRDRQQRDLQRLGRLQKRQHRPRRRWSRQQLLAPGSSDDDDDEQNECR